MATHIAKMNEKKRVHSLDVSPPLQDRAVHMELSNGSPQPRARERKKKREVVEVVSDRSDDEDYEEEEADSDAIVPRRSSRR